MLCASRHQIVAVFQARRYSAFGADAIATALRIVLMRFVCVILLLLLTMALVVGPRVEVCVSQVMQVPRFSTRFAWCNGRDDLGQGTFGAVRLAKIIESGVVVAVKSFDGTGANAAAVREAGILMRLNNRHAVRYLGLAKAYEVMMLVMEHCILGSLEAHNATWGHAMPISLAVTSELPRHPTDI